MLQVSWIEINNIIDPVRRNVIQNILAQVTVRVDDRQALTVSNVVDRHIGDQRRFTGSGLSDDVNMASPIDPFNSKDRRLALIVSSGKKVNVLFLIIC